MGIYDDMDTSNMNSDDWSGIDVGGDQGAGDISWDTGSGLGNTDGMNFGPGNSEQWNQVDNIPVFGTGQSAGGFLQDGNFTNYGDLGMQGQLGQSLNSAQSFLSNLFSGQQGKGIASVLGALVEGGQNKNKASAYNNLANQLRTSSDPFGSQRAQYQTALSNTIQNPYSQPIVAAQVKQLQQAQAIKDAAAGRRSNSATSSPALLAAQAQIAQNYMNSLMTPAGANISPNLSGYQQAATQGINAGVNGYTSPLASAIGYNQQSNNNTSTLINTLQKLLGGQ